jgi:hypothetical protein
LVLISQRFALGWYGVAPLALFLALTRMPPDACKDQLQNPGLAFPTILNFDIRDSVFDIRHFLFCIG